MQGGIPLYHIYIYIYEDMSGAPAWKLSISSARKFVQAAMDSSMAGYSKMLKDLNRSRPFSSCQHPGSAQHGTGRPLR